MKKKVQRLNHFDTIPYQMGYNIQFRNVPEKLIFKILLDTDDRIHIRIHQDRKYHWIYCFDCSLFDTRLEKFASEIVPNISLTLDHIRIERGFYKLILKTMHRYIKLIKFNQVFSIVVKPFLKIQ